VFELDLRAGELRRKGIKVKLQEQPFQVLSQLLEKPGEVVTREDLRNRLWPADTFVDFDHSLNAAIRRLRDALGDSAENPTYVETVARRGYRFLAPVETSPPNGDSAVQPALAITESTGRAVPRFRIWWIAAGAAAVVVILLGLVLVLLGLKLGILPGQKQVAQLRISRLTANPADVRVRGAGISRDGKYLAFSDETGFYLRLIDTGETHLVALPQGLTVGSVSWFPDNSHMVVALSGAGQKSSLWEVSALGGGARKICDDGRAPAVSPDGNEVAFIAGTKLREQVWLVGSDGSQPRKLSGEEGDFFGALAWSPDGSRLAYTTAKFAYGYGAKGVIDVVEVHSQRISGVIFHLTSVLSLDGLDGPLAWLPDGHLIYTVLEPRPRQLDSNIWSTALDAESKPVGTPTRLTNDAGIVFSVSISEDGKRVVYLKGVPQPDVYVAKLDSRGGISEPQRLTLDDRQDMPFDWTPDGKEVIFISDRTGNFNIYKQAVDRTVPDTLVGGSRPSMVPRLSPDGTQLLYVMYPNWGERPTTVPLMRVPLAGGAPQRVLQANWISNQQCARAPAKLCLYSLVRPGELTFFSFDPFQGKASQVFQVKDELPELYNWSLSPDGTTLAIAKGKWGDGEPRVHLVSLSGGAEHKAEHAAENASEHVSERWLTVHGWSGLTALDWAADSKSLWAPSVSEEQNVLLNIDLQGHARPVWRPKKMTVGWAIPSRDGRSLALHVNSTSANVWMLENP
jgi:Tol biopolymer transport system component/DNA-binding winged helix-turn-helix (wHTH) protein